LSGRLIARQAFHVAEDQRLLVAGRQPVQRFIEYGTNFAQALLVGERRLQSFGRPFFQSVSASVPGSRLSGQSVGDLVEPAAHRFSSNNRCRLAGQYEESCLKGVLGPPQHTPAHAMNHRAMALHQSSKGAFVLMVSKPFQQLAVGKFLGTGVGELPAQVPKDRRRARTA
jgi:hypothetical protein